MSRIISEVAKGSSLIKQVPRAKHVPQRTCIACGKATKKGELIRLVSTSGGLEVDFSGKKAGRGAYLCKTRECWETGLRKERLQHALKVKISPQNLEPLKEFGHDLPQRAAPDPG